MLDGDSGPKKTWAFWGSSQAIILTKTTFLFLSFGIMSFTFGQVEKEKRISRYLSHISLATHFTFINLSSTLVNQNNNVKIEYKTATATRFGLSFDYRWLGFELFTRMPFNEADKKGRTKNQGLYIRINKPRFWVNAVIQKFSGMYWANPNAESKAGLAPGYFPLRDDITCNLLHFNGYYIFSPYKFSNPAAQGENERQSKSGGSFLAGLGFFVDNMRSDLPLVPSSQIRNFENLALTNQMRARFFALSGGYAHTFVGWKKAFFTLYFAPGISRFSATQQQTDGERKTLKGQWAPRLDLRISMGYNTDKYFGGLMAQSVVNNQELGEGTTFSNGFETFRIFFGRRFAMKKQLGILGL